jgi:hypothetical protein
MSLFDDASLVLTPNGYKGGVTTGKLYSIKPTSGLGDMTVVRATTATRVNSAGIIESVAINVPRLDYTGGGCPSILVEPARTNKLFQSQDISSALWAKSIAVPTITTNIALAPDGTTTADGIQSSDALISFKTISQIIAVTANSTVTTSVFVKKETSETNFGGFAYVFTGVTTKTLRVIVNAVTGTAVISSDSILTGTTKVEDYGTYWRISATTTDNGSNTSLSYLYYGTISTNGTTTNTGIGSVRTVWGFQLELAANSTSYIPTTIAEITRNADVISKTGVSSLIGQTEGTIFMDLNFTNVGVDKYILVINNTANTNSIAIRRLSGGAIRIILTATTSSGITSQSSAVLANGNYKIAYRYISGSIKLYINGALSFTETPTFTFGAAIDNIKLGMSNGNSEQLNDTINSFQLYQTALDNDQCISLTTP